APAAAGATPPRPATPLARRGTRGAVGAPPRAHDVLLRPTAGVSEVTGHGAAHLPRLSRRPGARLAVLGGRLSSLPLGQGARAGCARVALARARAPRRARARAQPRRHL